MREAVFEMLARYDCQRVEDTTRALREILQELALLGLWRAKFFEKAAFYGGTALRILYGLDRFSEDLDFSLLQPMPGFELERYSSALERELAAFGFEVRVEQKGKAVETAVQSAFLKANTANELLVIQAGDHIRRQIPAGQLTRIKIEVDTDPPPGFSTENRFLLLPIPFSVRSYRLPDLFAGKMHAILCRRWKNRVKGRDWYDLVWYCARHPELHLAHLEQRMRQSNHWKGEKKIGPDDFQDLADEAISRLDVDQARGEVLPFVRDPEALEIWSRDFFLDVLRRIQFV
ncbi:Nucleotidyl transferase AbiEii toxin, Type IV TA system [Geoalkalibacter ferrihydriticus]|uniref:Nucleotidyl transferase, PF08843 family protein n=2 Tax=Geoalkalibacter ferrihydriticus TaxID=392333 RepID=A0A0C2EAV7_9BACT|nr:nucleotidyl transferase AbiEii/AbiGii toxin family protein [Geoalkalibacter ferrihydriticus]KIH75703.1 nucleotidyl transferase, PF08843 family protein [Geoalkalibacter ferrihydriticus DSM 17813]SDM74737.1 Nucleotidyl transferase AbiEii toxin, Type IV TA system [Geoalkalibacter ferrihydriticus]